MSWLRVGTLPPLVGQADIEIKVAYCVGGAISPLLANLYFRRFVLAWRQFGYEDRLNAHIVNYADDRAPRRRRREVVMAN
jgi:hypothetical protein